MSKGPRPRARLLGFSIAEILAVVLGVAFALSTPLRNLDLRWVELSLRRAASSAPSERMVVVEASPGLSKDGGCGAAFASVLTRGGARAGLALSPLSELCEGLFERAATDSELAPPIERLDERVLLEGQSGRIVGLAREIAGSPLLSALGLEPVQWLPSRALDAIPLLRLSELQSGDASPSLLTGRIALLALAGDSVPAEREPRAVAAALAAALEDRPRTEPARWLLCVIALLTSLGLAGIQRRSGAQRFARLGLAFAGLAVLALSSGDLIGLGLCLPLPSLLGAFSLSYVVLLVPRRAAVARADRDAQRVLSGAGRILSLRAPGAREDGEFWRRLARTAAQAHAADTILIAELPPFSWRLKVWSNGESDESVIKERRRDIRRTPYSNLQGVPVSSIVQDYLVMKGTPAVLVPLIAMNEVEGYLIMIGQSAADEFIERPQVAASLADGLAELIREYRLARVEDEAWRGEGTIRGLGSDEDANVLERARAAMGELRLLRALVRDAPVGLFYADSFGDVRILGRTVARWLPEFGIEVPAAADGSVDAGQLSLKQLLSGLGQKSGATPPPLTEIDESGYTLDVAVPQSAGQRVKSLSLRVVALQKGTSRDPAGFVGSLTESAILTASLMPRPSIMQQTVSSLQVFPLSKLLADLVQHISHRTEGKVALQSPRDECHVVAHRADLETALEAFLVEAARHSGGKSGPVLALAEKRSRIELCILDLRLDAPRPALERTLRAPSNPPAGLDALGALILAVENSHGEARLASDQSWGTVLVLALIRARPRIEAKSGVPPLRLYNKPVRIDGLR